MALERAVPQSLIDCISDLLRYDPAMRPTTRRCKEYSFLPLPTGHPGPGRVSSEEMEVAGTEISEDYAESVFSYDTVSTSVGALWTLRAHPSVEEESTEPDPL
jgi:hypothetical protein